MSQSRDYENDIHWNSAGHARFADLVWPPLNEALGARHPALLPRRPLISALSSSPPLACRSQVPFLQDWLRECPYSRFAVTNDSLLQGRVAVVTGATHGIGPGIAHELAARRRTGWQARRAAKLRVGGRRRRSGRQRVARVWPADS